ncbi:MAG TPA: hypothetical protein ENN19_17095 [Chloroflexi bacterium]|nr:hypothetical protein [Chloroflexota bacterium]
MLAIIEAINLIRYLIVLRPRQTLVKLTDCFANELSAGLGAAITAQLPTREAHEWQRTRQLWAARYTHDQEAAALLKENPLLSVPPAPWPIEALFFHYPVKQIYGQGEPILWELKLLGDAADHGFFLERILPALEMTATHPPEDMQAESVGFWGRYQIHAVYAARGAQWTPFVEEGELDFDHYPTPVQWRGGLELGVQENYTRPRQLLVWLTPFDLGAEPYVPPRHGRRRKRIAQRDLPTIESLIQASMVRVAQLLPNKHASPEDVWALMSGEERERVQEAINDLQKRSKRQSARIEAVPSRCFGQWRGTQKFATPIPEVLLPYLELASILHVGHHTHFGCGTFILR